MTSDLALRNFIDSDLEALNILRNDPSAISMMNGIFTGVEALSGTRSWIERQKQRYNFKIVSAAGSCAGFIKSAPISFGDRCKKYEEIGIAILEHCRGRGMAKFAVDSFIKSSNDGLFLVRIIKENEASLQLFKSFGFREIGELRGVVLPAAKSERSEMLDLAFMEYSK